MNERNNDPCRSESDEELQKFADDPKFIHFAGIINPPKPGVQACITELEYTYYIPGTPKNDDFFLRIINWSGMHWVLVSIPISERHLMEKVASENGLRIVDGVPSMFSGSNMEQFPINNERVFTLENKKGHPIYYNNSDINETLKDAENGRIEQIEKNWQSRN